MSPEFEIALKKGEPFPTAPNRFGFLPETAWILVGPMINIPRFKQLSFSLFLAVPQLGYTGTIHSAVRI